MDLDYAAARACALHYNLLAVGAARQEAETTLDELYKAFTADELEEPSAVSAGDPVAASAASADDPFAASEASADGPIAESAASAGDVVAVGATLYKVAKVTKAQRQELVLRCRPAFKAMKCWCRARD